MKATKPLWRFSVRTTLEAEDAVSDLLGSVFGQSASAHFNVETAVSLVTVFGERKEIISPTPRKAVAAGLNEIKRCGLLLGSGKIQVKQVRREDWAESWKRHFRAIEFGDALLVKPSWIRCQPRKNQAVILLDPGLSFGTGQHATTSFCLHEIVRCRLPDLRQSFLDIGTGSGILAIAAAKLGYHPVHAFDFDPEAVRVARANAGMNGIEARLKISRGDVTKLPLKSRRHYHLICANLISNLLIAERKRIIAPLHREGVLVLAGILKTEFEEVKDAFGDLGMKLVASKTLKEWRSGAFHFI